MPGGARQFFNLDLTWTRKFFEPSGHAGASFRVTSAHHQTVFRPPFMTASAPPLAFHDRQQRYPLAPQTLNLRLKARGGVPPLRPTSWPFSRNPSVGIQMVGERCKRVESPVELSC